MNVFLTNEFGVKCLSNSFIYYVQMHQFKIFPIVFQFCNLCLSCNIYVFRFCNDVFLCLSILQRCLSKSFDTAMMNSYKYYVYLNEFNTTVNWTQITKSKLSGLNSKMLRFVYFSIRGIYEYIYGELQHP